MVSMQYLTGMISINQTGKFPIMSQRGHRYIMILYYLIDAFEVLYQRLRDAGIKPIIQRLRNEASEAMIRRIKEKKMNYQLASPHDHWLNPAERAVQSFKNHFISNLHGCDKQFPAN